jgi:hypothetical protein
LALVVFAGFSRSYYLRPLFSTQALAPLLALHGLVMSGWVVLFVAQATLGAAHHLRWHRRLGAVGFGWFWAVLLSGFLVTVRSAHGGLQDRGALEFMAIALMDLVAFGGLTGAAFLFRRRPAVHRRLMLLGTIALLPPAVGRLPFEFIETGSHPVIFALLLGSCVLIIALDTRRERRLHPAFAAGLGFFALTVPLRLWVSTTPAWLVIATWLAEP